jgi:hypothetical protein
MFSSLMAQHMWANSILIVVSNYWLDYYRRHAINIKGFDFFSASLALSFDRVPSRFSSFGDN